MGLKETYRQLNWFAFEEIQTRSIGHETVENEMDGAGMKLAQQLRTVVTELSSPQEVAEDTPSSLRRVRVLQQAHVPCSHTLSRFEETPLSWLPNSCENKVIFTSAIKGPDKIRLASYPSSFKLGLTRHI